MQAPRRIVAVAAVALSLFAAACAAPVGPAAGPTTSAAPTGTGVAAGVAPVAATPVPASASATPTGNPAAITPTGSSAIAAQPAAAGTIRYEVVASGSEVAYRVREQLARLNAPSDAVGKTNEVTGSIVVDAGGRILGDQSKLTVDLTSLQSDSAMRDRFVKNNTLNTASFPTAAFVPTEIKGLAAPLPTSGQHTFQLLGTLTVHGVSRPVIWDVTGQTSGSDLTGRATTTVTFEDFGLTPPKVASVLSVSDSITLEVTLHLVRSA